MFDHGGGRMLLTKESLRNYLLYFRVSIPECLEKELLDEYGSYVIDDSGNLRGYTEQDIYEQLRKKIQPYEKKPAYPQDF